MALVRRLRLLLDDALYLRVAARRRQRKKRRAANAILGAEPGPVPGDLAELKREIGEAHSRRELSGE